MYPFFCKPCDQGFDHPSNLARHEKTDKHLAAVKIYNSRPQSTTATTTTTFTPTTATTSEDYAGDMGQSNELVEGLKANFRKRQREYDAAQVKAARENGAFRCDICDVVFTRKRNLETHKKSNTHIRNIENRVFTCKPCGLDFHTKGHLTLHQMTDEHLAALKI